MDSSSFQADVLPILADCAKLLERSSQLLQGPNAIVLIESEGMYPELLYSFNKLVRKLPRGGGIDVVLHSHGGAIDALRLSLACAECDLENLGSLCRLWPRARLPY